MMVVVFILYAFLIGFILVMMYRLVRAFERIADKVEEGITIKEKKEGI